jgi:ribosomal protein L19
MYYLVVRNRPWNILIRLKVWLIYSTRIDIISIKDRGQVVSIKTYYVRFFQQLNAKIMKNVQSIMFAQQPISLKDVPLQ